MHAYIRDATGLAPRSRVTIAGIPVGSLDSIRLENGEARLDVKVKNDVALYDNATLGKKSASLLGESVIVLTPGTPDHRKLHDGDEIHIIADQTTPGRDHGRGEGDRRQRQGGRRPARELHRHRRRRAARTCASSCRTWPTSTDALNQTIRENREVIRDTLRNVDAITQNANPQMAQILENVRVVTQDVRELMAAPGGQRRPEAGSLRDTIDRLDRASKSLESTLEHADSVAGRIDRGEGTIGKLTKDDALINEVQGVAEGVNDYVQNIVRLQTIVGLRSDYNFLANTLKTYVSLRLQPREDKYYELELIDDPRGFTSITDTNVDTTNPNEPAHYRTITTTTTEAFRFSLQFAKRFGPFTGRFGIKESTGGIGLDIHLLQDRFEIVNDLFGFSEEVQPRYRVFVSYEFIKHLWLLGGVDHLFEPTERDYFVGLQLRFDDEDLKTILPFSAPVAGAAGH